MTLGLANLNGQVMVVQLNFVSPLKFLRGAAARLAPNQTNLTMAPLLAFVSQYFTPDSLVVTERVRPALI
jgi:hypothetical protein